MLALPPAFHYACYYGRNRLAELSTYDLAILQPGQHKSDDIARLEDAGTRCLAYLSVGEALPGDVDPSWCLEDPHSGLPAIDPRWHTVYLDCRSHGWQEHLLHERVPGILNCGFSGLFLDTLDVQEGFPETRPELIRLLQRMRVAYPRVALVANRGFSALDAICPLVDGIVFEAFTSYWDSGQYRAWTGSDLQWTERQAARLHRLCGRLPILALDYALPEDVALRLLARQRALEHGFYSFVGPRGLDWLLPATGIGS